MKTQNISFSEVLKIIGLSYNHKHEFLKEILEYEIDTGLLRNDLYFNIFNDAMSWGTDPLFESSEQVGEYIKTGKI